MALVRRKQAAGACAQVRPCAVLRQAMLSVKQLTPLLVLQRCSIATLLSEVALVSGQGATHFLC